MGADFVFAITEIQVDKETALKHLATLSDDALLDIAEDVLGWEEEADDFGNAEEFRGCLEEAIGIVYDGYKGFRRDCGSFDNYVISGGMSWGDPPTDACSAIWMVEQSQVTLERETDE